MRILVVCQYYYPEQFRINDICEQLVQDGHSVTVLTGLPNYPTGKIPNEYRWCKKRKENINGVEVLRCFEISRKKGAVGMALNYMSYMVSASLKALFLKKDFDIIFSYQLSPVTMVLPAVIMKKCSRKPLYLYCCDIWPESIKNIISDENNAIYKIVKNFSRYIYSKCDAITVTSKPFIEYFNKEHSIPIERISYIPQHAEDIYLKMDFTPLDNITDFVFMGNIGVAQDIECIIDATEKIKHIPRFKVHFVGDGSYLEKSKMLVGKKGLYDIVFFHGRHSLDKMPYFYRLADVCLLTLKADNLIGLTMPSKLQGYMAAGKAVIGAINGAAQDVINESQCGICVKASDSNALAATMKDFIENYNKYEQCGENGRKYFVSHFTKEKYMMALKNELNKLVEAR
ncbi:glycosyltransferase family 4 protein [Clostridium sp. UBA3887]|uniref:glycosyltransferase family 4 protein n=1 Tax=Clostridium sp. UBA3887 TaxID=1946356 RepID=UPI0032172D78